MVHCLDDFDPNGDMFASLKLKRFMGLWDYHGMIVGFDGF